MGIGGDFSMRWEGRLRVVSKVKVVRLESWGGGGQPEAFDCSGGEDEGAGHSGGSLKALVVDVGCSSIVRGGLVDLLLVQDLYLVLCEVLLGPLNG